MMAWSSRLVIGLMLWQAPYSDPGTSYHFGHKALPPLVISAVARITPHNGNQNYRGKLREKSCMHGKSLIAIVCKIV
jgi:hypothetical protein